jgi:predicted nucleic acid-binding protein
MITAVDSNVLLDIFTADPEFGEPSAEAIRESMLEGKLIACEVVWAEISASFPDITAAKDALHQLGIEFSPMEETSCLDAGKYWKRYRKSGGTRSRIIPDFLIGSHALRQADRLLTRDRGFYRKYFSHLKVIDPSAR